VREFKRLLYLYIDLWVVAVNPFENQYEESGAAWALIKISLESDVTYPDHGHEQPTSGKGQGGLAPHRQRQDDNMPCIDDSSPGHLDGSFVCSVFDLNSAALLFAQAPVNLLPR
jgi:hypothetical protein